MQIHTQPSHKCSYSQVNFFSLQIHSSSVSPPCLLRVSSVFNTEQSRSKYGGSTMENRAILELELWIGKDGFPVGIRYKS